ncbi:MAG: hypothetical protein E3J69_06095 [Anaerolineales bacterium]|nr:MAG: hypothetical protein E3J69_06095 [Anaerolineales bacterium]
MRIRKSFLIKLVFIRSRRVFGFLLLNLILVSACRLVSPSAPSPTATLDRSPTKVQLGPTWTPEQSNMPTSKPTPKATSTPDPCDQVFFDPQGRLAFSLSNEGNDDIYIMHSDGRDVTRLTISPGVDTNPSWSPSDEMLAIESDRGLSFGETDILVIDLEGTILHRLGSPASVETNPQWSPDGLSIAYSSFRGGISSIVISDLDGMEKKEIPSPYRWNIQPTWSPDGRNIAWLGNEGTSGDYLFDVLIYDTINSTSTILTEGFQAYPGIYYAWAPDGEALVLSLYRNRISDIYMVDIATRNLIRLTDDDARDLEPSWSLDGEKLAFISDREGDYDVFVMNRDGTEVRQISFTKNDDQFPAWSPDGKYIAFLAKTELSGDVIHIADLDGCATFALTDAISTNVTRPVWSHDLVR